MLEHKAKVTGETTPSQFQPFRKHQNEERTTKAFLARDKDPLAQVPSRIGDTSCAAAHASRLNRAISSRLPRVTDSLLRLQRRYGNRHVQRVLALARQADGEAEVAPEIEQAIQRARGGGQALDSKVRTQMGSAFGADFSNVRVHTNAEADTLSQQLNARAFTTGHDIFFRRGEYNPGSSSGRELLAHELTHVVQQSNDELQRKLTVSQPGDRYEQEADRVAEAVMQKEQRASPQENHRSEIRRQEEEELQMQPLEEEEEELQTQLLEEDEEEQETGTLRARRTNVQTPEILISQHGETIRRQEETPEWKKQEKKFELLIGDLKPKAPKSNLEKLNLGLGKLLTTFGHEKTPPFLSPDLRVTPEGRLLWYSITRTASALWMAKQGKIPDVIPDIKLRDDLLLDVELGGTFEKPSMMLKLKWTF
jgi:hypothetical protein